MENDSIYVECISPLVHRQIYHTKTCLAFYMQATSINKSINTHLCVPLYKICIINAITFVILCLIYVQKHYLIFYMYKKMQFLFARLLCISIHTRNMHILHMLVVIYITLYLCNCSFFQHMFKQYKQNHILYDFHQWHFCRCKVLKI